MSTSRLIPRFLRDSDSSLHNFRKFHEQEQKDTVNPYQDYYPVEELHKLEYKARPSIFNEFDPEAPFRRSIFYGYFQLFFVFGCFFFICHPYLKFQEEGRLFNPDLFKQIQNSFLEAVATWPFFIIYCHTAFVLQWMHLPLPFERILQHISQAGVLSIALLVSYIHKDWYPSSRCFVAVMSWVFFMKMHSYTIEMRTNKYPQVYKEFWYFIWAPTFVFQRCYPRRQAIDYGLVVIKSLYTLAGFLGLYIIVSDWLQPILEQANNMHFAELFLKLIEVCFYLNLVIFYIVMETMLQLFAEFTRFADRLFYADWWNSTSYIDYMIKFNRPVSDFTYRYVYEPLQHKAKLSPTMALRITNSLQAAAFELILVSMVRGLKPFIFLLVVIQIPIYRLFLPLRGKHAGNIVFWLGYLLIVPFIVTCYICFPDPISYLFHLNW